MRKNYFLILLALVCFNVNAQMILSEDFDDVDTLTTRPTNKWAAVNLSNPVGDFGWSNGGGPVKSGFAAYNGDTTSCLIGSYGSVSGQGLISNFFVTPSINLKNGDSVSFYVRVPLTLLPNGNVKYPDRLIVRINTVDDMADSLDFGDGEFTFGKYDSVLLDLNPTWSGLPYPVGMPIVWTKVSTVISKFTGSNARPSRIAFHNYNDDGGISGAKSNLIGIDALRIKSGILSLPKSTIESFSVFPNPASNSITISGKDISAVSVLSLDGKELINVANFNSKINIENLAPGFYSLKIESNGQTFYKPFSKR